MSIESIESQPVTEVTEPVVLETPASVELRYEYQPTDEQGRPLGAKQVIKYATPDELAAKLTEQNTLLIRKLREETRKNRLGVLENETIPDDAPRYEQPFSAQPRTLTAEEQIRISRDLLDPEKFDEASDALLDAKFGGTPGQLVRKVAELEADVLRFRAKAECDAFMQENPAYVKCQDNADAIANWMLRYGLAPVKANFQRAYNKLRTDKVLIETYEDVADPAPVILTQVEPVVEEIAPVDKIEQPLVIEQPKPNHARIPTGLNRTMSDDTGTIRSVADDIVYETVVNGQKRRFTGLSAINAMPSDEYKRRVMTDPNFAKREIALEREAEDRRRAARR